MLVPNRASIFVPQAGQVCAPVSVRSKPHFGHCRVDAIAGRLQHQRAGPAIDQGNLSFAHDAGFLLFQRLVGPGHARCVVGDADMSLRVEDDDAAVSVDTLL